jgi:hypothetical protein
MPVGGTKSCGHQAQKLGSINVLHLNETLREADDLLFASDQEIVRAGISILSKLFCLGFRNFVEQRDQRPHIAIDP